MPWYSFTNFMVKWSLAFVVHYKLSSLIICLFGDDAYLFRIHENPSNPMNRANIFCIIASNVAPKDKYNTEIKEKKAIIIITHLVMGDSWWYKIIEKITKISVLFIFTFIIFFIPFLDSDSSDSINICKHSVQWDNTQSQKNTSESAILGWFCFRGKMRTKIFVW